MIALWVFEWKVVLNIFMQPQYDLIRKQNEDKILTSKLENIYVNAMSTGKKLIRDLYGAGTFVQLSYYNRP